MRRRLAMLLSLAMVATSIPQPAIFAEELFTDSVSVAEETPVSEEVPETAITPVEVPEEEIEFTAPAAEEELFISGEEAVDVQMAESAEPEFSDMTEDVEMQAVADGEYPVAPEGEVFPVKFEGVDGNYKYATYQFTPSTTGVYCIKGKSIDGNTCYLDSIYEEDNWVYHYDCGANYNNGFKYFWQMTGGLTYNLTYCYCGDPEQSIECMIAPISESIEITNPEDFTMNDSINSVNSYSFTVPEDGFYAIEGEILDDSGIEICSVNFYLFEEGYSNCKNEHIVYLTAGRKYILESYEFEYEDTIHCSITKVERNYISIDNVEEFTIEYSPNEMKYYTFQAPGNGVYEVVGLNIQAGMTIYDEYYQYLGYIGSNDDKLEIKLNAGKTYYIEVNNFSDGGTQTVQIKRPQAEKVFGEFSISFNGSTNEKWYSFDITEPGMYQIGIKNDGYEKRLYDNNFQEYVLYEDIEYHNLDEGTYYLRVYGPSGEEVTYQGIIQLTEQVYADQSFIVDTSESWFRFIPNTTGVYKFGSPVGSDVYMHFYDSSGSYINGGSSFTWDCEAGKTYYLQCEIVSYGNGAKIEYEISSVKSLSIGSEYAIEVTDPSVAVEIPFVTSEYAKYEFTFDTCPNMFEIDGMTCEKVNENTFAKILYPNRVYTLCCTYENVGQYTVSAKKILYPEIKEGTSIDITESTYIMIQPIETGRYCFKAEKIQNNAYTDIELYGKDMNWMDSKKYSNSQGTYIYMNLKAGETYYLKIWVEEPDSIQYHCTLYKEKPIKNIRCINVDKMSKIFAEMQSGWYEYDGLELTVEYEDGSETTVMYNTDEFQKLGLDVGTYEAEEGSSIYNVLAYIGDQSYVLYQIEKLSRVEFFEKQNIRKLTVGETDSSLLTKTDYKRYYTFQADEEGKYTVQIDSEEYLNIQYMISGSEEELYPAEKFTVDLKKGQMLYLYCYDYIDEESETRNIDVTVSKTKIVTNVECISPAKGGEHYHSSLYDKSGMEVKIIFEDGITETVAYDSELWKNYGFAIRSTDDEMLELYAEHISMEPVKLYPITVYKTKLEYAPYIQNKFENNEYIITKLGDKDYCRYVAYKAEEAGTYVLTGEGIDWLEVTPYTDSINVEYDYYEDDYWYLNNDDSIHMSLSSAGYIVMRIAEYEDWPNAKLKIHKLCTEHKYSDGVVVNEPTCENSGKTVYTCAVCNDKKSEYMESLGHDWETDYTVDKAATTTEPGSKSIHCSRCDEIQEGSIVEIPVITEHTHDYKEEVLEAPTCTKAGSKKLTCTICSETKTEEIPATGNHSYDEGEITVDPSCEEPGERTYTCTICEETKEEVIKATGKHDWESWETTKRATVLATGRQERSCAECGKTERKNLEKLKATGKLNMTTISLKVKQNTTALKVTGLAYGDKVKSYSSSNKKVFTVSSKGKIYAKGKGTAKLTVTLASNKKLTATVKVVTGTVRTTKITVDKKSLTLKRGKSYQLKTTLTPLTSQEKVTYTSSKKSVATVNSKGKITAKKKGTAYITVKSGKKSVKVKVVVK